MSKLSRRDLLLSGAAAASLQLRAQTKAAVVTSLPPVARVDPVEDIYFGTRVIDPYRWMEIQPHSEEFNSWMKAEAAFAKDQLDALPHRDEIKASLRTYLADVDVAFLSAVAGDDHFIFQIPKGSSTGQLYLRDHHAESERLLIDPNAGKAAQEPLDSFDYTLVSPSGGHVAYGISTAGSEVTATYILNVSTGKTIKVTPISSRGAGWTADETGFFYYRLRTEATFGTQDYRKGGSCWLHRLGTDPARDVEVFRSGEGPQLERQESDTPKVLGAPGSDWLVGIHLLNDDFPNQVYVARADALQDGRLNWRKIAGRADNIREIALVGDNVYLLANGRQSHGEIVKVDAASGVFASSPIVVPASDGVINELAVAKDGIYLSDLTNSLGGLRRLTFDGAINRVTPPFAGALWSVKADRNADGVFFGMDDLTTPATTFSLSSPTAIAQPLHLAPPPPYDVTAYKTTRATVTVRDGAEVPIEILHRKALKHDSANPTLVNAYGAYGNNLDPGFEPEMLAFLDQGGVLVYAHVRGGGEKGEAWHAAGQKSTKPNTWRDAIDVSEWLIAQRWTSKPHLAIWGVSAGGIMVGRAITERPDLFAAAVCEVGMVNPLRAEFTANGPGNDAEFGSVKTEAGFKALLAQDTIQAIKDGVYYPAVLAMTGANDQRVEPWMLGKLTARLQTASTNKPGAILRVDSEAGHFAATMPGRIAKATDMFSFVLAHTSRA